MESSTRRLEEERKKQEDIRRQIALLQSQLKATPADSPLTVPTSPKRKQPEGGLLVPATPSPKKRKLSHKHVKVPPYNHQPTPHANSSNPIMKKELIAVPYPKPGPSNVLNKLATLGHSAEAENYKAPVVRSSAFNEKPSGSEVETPGPFVSRRDDRLALVEDLEPGPFDYTPSFDDPDFQHLEPNSCIRLSSRSVSHEDLQDHLRGRYYLSPSRLYSAIRLLPDKQGYDVPVPGDWITIAVVAERGAIKYSRAPVATGLEDNGSGTGKQPDEKRRRGKEKADDAKPTGKKYVNFKLIDFGARAQSSSSATGGKSVIRGDAFLSLLLFESDRFDLVTEEGETKPRKIYRGGSRGAFENLTKMKEGDVVVLLNPKILKPFQRSNDNPHPTNNILALTPESASSIMVIGRARDLGMCTVAKRDGKACGSWCDKRVSDVCEWHIQNAVERRRAGRAEFSIGTTGMSVSSVPKRKPQYDPARQWGLKPSDSTPGGGGSTYVVAGHIVNSSGVDSRSLYTTENIGREGQAKAKRRLSGKDSDRALRGLLERDKEGMRAVMKAREAVKVYSNDDSKRKEKKERGAESKPKPKHSEDGPDDLFVPDLSAGKAGYSAEIIKQLGFNPIAKTGLRKGGDSDMQKKLNALTTAQASRKDIALGPRPGGKIRSAACAVKEDVKVALTSNLVSLDDRSGDLPRGPLITEGGMVDLDDI